MNTPFTQEGIIFALLNDSEVRTAITGKLIVGDSVSDYAKENVTVNSLLLGSGSIQRGAVNINIHVPDISVTVGGKTTKQRNNERLKLLTEMVATVLTSNGYSSTYNFWLDEESAFTIFKNADGIDNHFAKIKVQFKFHNSNK